MSRTTLRDIARQTGFAHSTVSLALRGSPKANRETTAVILSAARKLGYTPHPLLSALMQSRRTRVASGYRAQLGFLLFHAEKPDSMSATTRKVLTGATARAKEFGYHVVPLWADDPDLRNERIARILEAQGIHGVIFGPAPGKTAEIALPWERFACISLNLGSPSGADYVGHYYYDGMKLALMKCRQCNFLRIGVALPKWKNPLMLDQYLLPFLASMATLPAAKRVPPYLYPLRPEESLRRWITRYKPDVIISSIDSEQGDEFIRRHIPPTVAYISLNADVGVTAGVDQNRPLIGAVAVDQLVAKINRNERGLTEHAHLTYVFGRWVTGPTLNEKSRGGR